MQVAEVIGRATATIKHDSMSGWRMLVVQPLGNQDQSDGDLVIAIDKLGAGAGDRVILSSDGKQIRKLTGSNSAPIRWWVMGLEDE